MRIFFWIFFLAVVPIFAGATSAGIPDSGRKVMKCLFFFLLKVYSS